jgi:hypothetical protein
VLRWYGILNEWRKKEYKKMHCTDHHQEEGNLHISGNYILNTLRKIQVWTVKNERSLWKLKMTKALRDNKANNKMMI